MLMFFASVVILTATMVIIGIAIVKILTNIGVV